MRLMISQPMNGKPIEQIRNERKALVDELTAQGHTVVDTIITEESPENANRPLWCLGKSLMDMSECDGVVFMPGWASARGCMIEHAAAQHYGLFIKEMY